MSVTKKLFSFFTALTLALTVAWSVPAKSDDSSDRDEAKISSKMRVHVPLNLAVLVQDDLVSRVGNELNVTRNYIRALPKGSRVMVAYIRSGSLQVRQPFTNDLDKAAKALRLPVASTAVSPYNPYVEVIEALRKFDNTGNGRNAVLLISDGLDVSRGFDITSAANTLDLERAIREAKQREIPIYSFYAPTVGLTSWNRFAVSAGQSSLNRLSDETGGKAFFQGTSFVSFDPYFERLSRSLNEKYGRAY